MNNKQSNRVNRETAIMVKQQNSNGKERTDATLQVCRESISLNQSGLAALLGITTGRLADMENGVIQTDNGILEFLNDRRLELIEEIQSFLAEEQRMRQTGEANPSTGQWAFDLYRNQPEYEAADPPTHITEYQTWNHVYRIIGLLMEALGYKVKYTYIKLFIREIAY